MEGWKLRKGNYKEEIIETDDIWQIFNYIFSTKSVNRTSYKFGFLKALLENVFNANHEGEISLEKIFYTFAHIYWSLIVKYNLKQGDRGVKGGKTSIEKIFDQYIEKYEHIKRAEFSSIKEEIQKEIAKAVLKECKKYVVGATYGDSNGTL